MVVFPHCKINLGLQVLFKRPDGYHELSTCFYPVPWTDILEIIEAPAFQFTQTGTDIPGSADENLCVKAYRLLSKEYALPPVHIHLHKIIPTGAGLGGGSSDAAFTLKLLNEKFALRLSLLQLQQYAATLGSDCAFFLHTKPMWGSGRGEVLTEAPVSLKGKYLVLVKPDVHVSTAAAYAGIQPAVPGRRVEQLLTELGVEDWKHVLVNDFEKIVFPAFTEIEPIKNALYRHGAIYASMSGSGAAVFGLFDREVSLHHFFPSATCWSGYLTV